MISYTVADDYCWIMTFSFCSNLKSLISTPEWKVDSMGRSDLHVFSDNVGEWVIEAASWSDLDEVSPSPIDHLTMNLR